MWVKKRHHWVFALLRPVFRIYFRFHYRFKAERYPLPKGPHLILGNHVTTMDVFMMALSFDRPVYYIASDDLFNKKLLSWILQTLVAPIPKSKSVSDLQAVKTSLRVIEEGGTIGIFPEGNRTYSGRQCRIDPSIAKLCKLCKVPVVLYHIEGGYGAEPRWANHISKGRVRGFVVRVLSVEEVRELSVEDLYETIKTTLHVDNLHPQVSFHSRRGAEKLERILYRCPNCHSLQTVYSHRTHLFCRKCDLKVEYTPELSFAGNISHHNVLEWFEEQERWMAQFPIEKDKTVFQDEDVRVFHVIRLKRKELINRGMLLIKTDGLLAKSKDKEQFFSYESIKEMTVVGKHKLNFYIDQETYQLKGQKDFNVLKIIQLFYHCKGDKDEFLGL